MRHTQQHTPPTLIHQVLMTIVVVVVFVLGSIVQLQNLHLLPPHAVSTLRYGNPDFLGFGEVEPEVLMRTGALQYYVFLCVYLSKRNTCLRLIGHDVA